MARTYPKASDEFELVPEGWRLVTVRKCGEKRSAKGDAYYNLELEDDHTGSILWDTAMLEGGGQSIGQRKLLQIGAAEDLGDEVSILEPYQIEGIQAMAYVTHEEYNGKTNAKVNIRFGEAGYMPADWTPPGHGEGGGRLDVGPEPEDDGTPF